MTTEEEKSITSIDDRYLVFCMCGGCYNDKPNIFVSYQDASDFAENRREYGQKIFRINIFEETVEFIYHAHNDTDDEEFDTAPKEVKK